jgi:hypothetical protein
MWSECKHNDINNPNSNATAIAAAADEGDEWSNDDDAIGADQLWLHEHEPHPKMTPKDSPIPYWVSKRSIWPQLAQMALDVYSTVLMSDAPECAFSGIGMLLTPCRRNMTGEGVEQMECLRSWQGSGIISLDQGLFNSAVATTSIDDDDPVDLNSSNLLQHEQMYEQMQIEID